MDSSDELFTHSSAGYFDFFQDYNATQEIKHENAMQLSIQYVRHKSTYTISLLT